MKRGLGFRAPAPDKRDWPLSKLALTAQDPSGSADLTWQTPEVLDQGPLGSCVWNAIASLVQANAVKLGNPKPSLLSRLYGYRNTLSMAGDGLNDFGCDPRTAMKAVNTWGICDESLWPYDVATWKRWPSTGDSAIRAAFDARRSEKWDYYWILSSGEQKVREVKLALDAGYQVFIGGIIGPEYEDWTKGDAPLGPPSVSAGGHANKIEAYTKDIFRLLNSWGRTFGDDGRVLFSSAYIASPMIQVLMVIRKSPQVFK